MEWGYSSWQLLCFPQSNRGRDFFWDIASCISISLRIPSQVETQHLPQCNLSASHSSQGPAGGTCCCVLAGIPQTSAPTPGEAWSSSWPITHLSVLWGVNNAHVCPSIHLREAPGFKACSLACPSFRTLSSSSAEDKNKLTVSVINMLSSETADLHSTYLISFKNLVFVLPPTPVKIFISEPPLIPFAGLVYRKGFFHSFLTANTRSEPHLIFREEKLVKPDFWKTPPWVFLSYTRRPALEYNVWQLQLSLRRWRRTDYHTSNFYKTFAKILSFTAVQWLSGCHTTDIIIAGKQMGMTWALWIMSFTTAFFYAGFRYY